MNNNGQHSAQQPSYTYPVIWALYLIGFIGIAHCFDASSSIFTLPAVSGTHFVAVLGFGSFNPPACNASCQALPRAPKWPSLQMASPTDTCSNISINPDLQSGCGFSFAPTPSPSPGADLSASAPEELPAPTAALDAPPYTHTPASSDATPNINE